MLFMSSKMNVIMAQRTLCLENSQQADSFRRALKYKKYKWKGC